MQKKLSEKSLQFSRQSKNLTDTEEPANFGFDPKILLTSFARPIDRRYWQA
jgi:hypothetical protein